MYVTVERPAFGESKSQTINFTGRKIVTVREIFWEVIGIQKLFPNEKIWIKKENEAKFKKDPYKLDSQLDWISFNKCIIVLSPNYPLKKIEEKLDTLDTNVKSWKEKRERIGPPRHVLEKQHILRVLKKKQALKRLENERDTMAALEKDDDKKNIPDT